MVHGGSGLLRRRVGALGRQRREADALRVGVVHGVAEAVAADDHDEAMFAHRLDEQFHAGDFDLLQEPAHGDAALGGRPAGAAVADLAGVIHRAEVAAHRHVARADLEVDAERLQDAAADAVLERVVTEQAQVAGAAAGRNSGQNRGAQAANALPGCFIQIGSRSAL